MIFFCFFIPMVSSFRLEPTLTLKQKKNHAHPQKDRADQTTYLILKQPATPHCFAFDEYVLFKDVVTVSFCEHVTSIGREAQLLANFGLFAI